MRVRKLKVNMRIAPSIHEELMHESARLERSVGWLMRKAWLLAAREIKRLRADPSRPSGNVPSANVAGIPTPRNHVAPSDRTQAKSRAPSPRSP